MITYSMLSPVVEPLPLQMAGSSVLPGACPKWSGRLQSGLPQTTAVSSSLSREGEPGHSPEGRGEIVIQVSRQLLTLQARAYCNELYTEKLI